MLNAEQLGEALRRAFNLGQTYWRQADSDSYKQNALSDKTLNQFNDLVRDTVAAHGVAPAEPLGHEDDILALCERLENDDLRDADPATAAATIRSLCRQLDATRGVQEVPASGPLRELGAYLASLLDEDQWAKAEALLLKAAPGVQEDRNG